MLFLHIYISRSYIHPANSDYPFPRPKRLSLCRKKHWELGTIIHPSPSSLHAREHYLQHTLDLSGQLYGPGFLAHSTA